MNRRIAFTADFREFKAGDVVEQEFDHVLTEIISTGAGKLVDGKTPLKRAKTPKPVEEKKS